MARIKQIAPCSVPLWAVFSHQVDGYLYSLPVAFCALDEENNISTFVIDQKGPCTVDSVEDSFCTFETNGTTPERSDARILYLSQKYGTHRNMEPEEEEKE